MRIMNKLLMIGGAAALLAPSMGSAADKTRLFEFDKGQVVVTYADSVAGDKGYELTYQTPADCRAKVSVKENGSNVRVEHSEGACQSGSTFKLRVAKGTVAVILANGRLEFADAKKFVKEASVLLGFVEAGMIQSSIADLRPVPTNNYAGSSLTYKGKAGGPALELRVGSGMLEL